MNSNKHLERKIDIQDKQIKDLYVVIETLQHNLRAAVSCLPPKHMEGIATRSYKWAIHWRPGDEK